MRMLNANSYQDVPRLTPVESNSAHDSSAERAEPSRPSLLDYWRVIRRYKWAILAFGVAAGVIGAINALSTTSVYRAQARLWISYNQPHVANVSDFEVAPLHWLFFQTQSDIINSHAIAERVAARLGLEEPKSQPGGQGPETAIERIASVGSYFSDFKALLKSWLPEELRPPRPEPLDARERRAAFINSVLGGLSISGGTESEVLIIRYESDDPRKAAAFANTFAETYIDYGLESRSTNIHRATSWLGHRIEELREKTIASENALREFRAREGLVDSAKREQMISARLGSLTAELIKAQARRSEAEARYAQVKAVLDDNTDYESIASAIESTIVLETHRQKLQQEKRVAELSERYGPKHPKMISAMAELQEADRRLKAEVSKGVDGVRKDVEVAIAQEQRFRSIIKKQQLEMQQISGKAFEMIKLERDVEANRRLYETFLDRFKESDVADEYDVPNARIIDRALVPTVPFKPDRKRIVFVYILIGLAIGALNAFLRDHLSNKFKTKEDVEERLNLPVIGVVPRLKSDSSRTGPVERFVFRDPRSTFSEVINDIRTAILFSHIDTASKIVLVTSAVAGEGKTTLVSNLALSFSKRAPTLLIDADLRKGRVEQIANMVNHAGLTDMLSGACTPGEAIVSDPEAENLSVLMTGTFPPNPLEILSSNRFSETLESLRKQFKYIVIDGPPLLPVSDSMVVARLVDSTILTVKTDDTPWDVTVDALKRLRSAQVEPVGVVMQQVDFRKMRAYRRRYMTAYGGYYGYQMPKTT